MDEFVRILIGTAVLILGVPIGNFLAKQTKEELSDGQKWFKILTIISIIGGLFGLIMRNDFILFSFLFIAIVTVRSIKSKVKKSKR